MISSKGVKQSLKTAEAPRKVRIVFNPAEILIYIFFTQALVGSTNNTTN